MTELTTYLKHLKFDPKLNNSPFAKYLRNTRLVILTLILVCILGVVSYTKLPLVLNPTIKIPIVSVATSLPGASPDDVESLVTIPVEDSLGSLQKVKTMTSSSQDSVSVVTLEFESGVDPDKAKADVQSAVDSITTLPKEVETPSVQKFDFENEPVWTFTLSSKTDYLSLVRFGKTLRDALKDLPSIDKVQTTGLDTEEIQILVNPEKITEYGINPQTLSQAIQSASGSLPGGSITSNTSSFILTLDPTVTTIEDLRKMRISVNGGSSVLLSDIADIRRRIKPDAANSYFADKNQAPVETIRFDVFKTSSSNITQAVDDARKLTEKMAGSYHGKFVVSSVLNSGEEITTQYTDLIRDLIITVSLVFITLFIFLGIRQAIVASLAIPLTFLVTFTVMDSTGIALSFIAFFSLLLSLGLLVDDTIVVVSALTAYYRTGKFTPFEAGMLVWKDFRTAIFTTTLTTVWAFVPLLLATGIIGEFIKAIPIVVSSTLLGSFGVALFMTLPIGVLILGSKIPHRVTVLFRIIGVIFIFAIFFAIAPKGPLFIPALLLFLLNLYVYFQVRYLLYRGFKQKIKAKTGKRTNRSFTSYLDHGLISFEVIGSRYRRIINRILVTRSNRNRTIGAVILFSLFSYLLLPLGFVHSEFFPKDDQNYLYLSLELPAGTKLTTTDTEALKVLDDVRKMPNVEFTTATTRLGIDPGRGYNSSGDNTALITLVLPDKGRDKTSIDIADDLRHKYENYKKGTISVVEVSGGPPAGSDIQIKLYGEDLAVLDGYANKIQDHLKDQTGITNVSKSIKSGTSKIVFVPDYQKMLDAGITQDQVGFWLRTYASGFTLQSDAKLETGSQEKQDIVLRTNSNLQSVEAVNSIVIPTDKGQVPIASLGRLELRPNPTLITREEGKRTISVSAGITKGGSIPEKNKELETFADSLHLPDGYSWKTGGANEENNNSVTSILQAMLLSFFLIIVTMVLQFSSFRKAFIVMLVIPLSISGVFIMFSITNTPLSFPALIGVLALFGIVVKNSILVVDKINQNLKTGMKFNEAIIDGAESRLEPIALTTFATIIGLVPITLSDPLWRGLGGAIISGLAFSGSIMLFFIPVVYYLMFRSSEGKTEKATNLR